MRFGTLVRSAAVLSHRWKYSLRDATGDEARRFVQTRVRVQQATETEQTMSTEAIYERVAQRLGPLSAAPIV